MHPHISALTAAVLALMYASLSSWIAMYRMKARVGIGHGDNKQLRRLIRVHGNFAEYVPFCLLLLCFAESAGYPKVWLFTMAVILIVGRISHALGLGRSAGASMARTIGTALTLSVMVLGALMLLVDVIQR